VSITNSKDIIIFGADEINMFTECILTLFLQVLGSTAFSKSVSCVYMPCSFLLIVHLELYTRLHRNGELPITASQYRFPVIRVGLHTFNGRNNLPAQYRGAWHHRSGTKYEWFRLHRYILELVLKYAGCKVGNDHEPSS
jgi:hypothetical protein